jgi:hypothetical protein
MAYALKIYKTKIVRESGDSAVEILAILTDNAGVPFRDSTGALDLITIRAPKSSIPPTNHLDYLKDLTLAAIGNKYDFEGQFFTDDPVGDTLKGETDTISKLFIGLEISGPGITVATTMVSILSSTEAKLSSNLVLKVKGATTSPKIIKTGTVTLDSNHITGLSSTSDLEEGFVVSGSGVPSGATIASILSSSEIVISLNAVSSPGSTTLTFTTNPGALNLVSESPIFTNDGFLGMTVSGDEIPSDTTVSKVLTSTEVEMSQAATGGTSSVKYTFSGNGTYQLATSNLSLDLSALQYIVDVIDLNNL